MTHKNLRPISNLQFVSKITDRAVFDQFYGHMTDNELFPVLQSAHRKGHNTETALVRVLNAILSNMNKQHVSILVLLDLSAAFDTVDHAILLRRLETSFGITDAALAWFSSYLSGRSQCVSINGETSDCYPLPFGVPQGSWRIGAPHHSNDCKISRLRGAMYPLQRKRFLCCGVDGFFLTHLCQKLKKTKRRRRTTTTTKKRGKVC